MAFRKNTLFTPYVFRLYIEGEVFRSVGKKEMDGQVMEKWQELADKSDQFIDVR